MVNKNARHQGEGGTLMTDKPIISPSKQRLFRTHNVAGDFQFPSSGKDFNDGDELLFFRAILNLPS